MSRHSHRLWKFKGVLDEEIRGPILLHLTTPHACGSLRRFACRVDVRRGWRDASRAGEEGWVIVREPSRCVARLFRQGKTLKDSSCRTTDRLIMRLWRMGKAETAVG